MIFKKSFQRPVFHSIRFKLTFMITLFIILSISASKLYDYNVRSAELREQFEEEKLSAAKLTAVKLELEITKAITTLETEANNSVFLSKDQDVLVEHLKSIKERNSSFSTVFLSDASLNRINQDGETTSLADREYMQEVKQVKETVISKEVLISQATNKPAIMVVTPITVEGASESYLGISINVANFQSIIDEQTNSDSDYTFAFDGNDGLVFAHPVAEYVGSLKVINPDDADKDKVSSELEEMAKAASAGESGTKIYYFNGVKVIAAYTNIPGTSLGVIARMSYKEAMAPIRGERNSAIVIILVTSIISAIFAAIFSWYISNPIKKITKKAGTIASGDFTGTSDAMTVGRDEVGKLQKAFHSMAVMLKATMEEISQAAAKIALASRTLEMSAEQSAQGASQAAGAVSEVALGAADQADAIDNTVEIMRDMSNQIGNIAVSASAAADSSKETAAAAAKGDTAIHKVIDSITNMNVMVQDTAGVMRELGVSSDKISRIVDTISGIAAQTNMLALNAAIEAARSGEQGKGFSVVAEEIRKLAEQSKTSADDITQIIKDIQSQTRYAIIKMDNSAKEVSLGQDVVFDAGKSFREIQEQINSLNKSFQEISQLVQKLTLSCKNVVDSVEKVKGISQDTSANTQNISAFTEEQAASMQEVASSSVELLQLSNDLEKMLQTYKF